MIKDKGSRAGIKVNKECVKIFNNGVEKIPFQVNQEGCLKIGKEKEDSNIDLG